MPKNQLTVIFWNVWAWSQDGRRGDGSQLRNAIDELIKKYDPDIFGFNEILVDMNTGKSPVLDHMKTKGYFVHHSPFSPMTKPWMTGNAYVSKRKPTHITDHILGKDYQAERFRGHKDCYVKAIEAHTKVAGQDIAIIVPYLQALMPRDWGVHIKHRRAYEKVMADVPHQNLIIGGDFNETKYMLPWLRLPKHLGRRTGTFRKPTWRWDGQRRKVARANYDHLVWNKDSNLRLKHFEVLPSYPSDHTPLLGVFEVIIDNDNA